MKLALSRGWRPRLLVAIGIGLVLLGATFVSRRFIEGPEPRRFSPLLRPVVMLPPPPVAPLDTDAGSPPRQRAIHEPQPIPPDLLLALGQSRTGGPGDKTEAAPLAETLAPAVPRPTSPKGGLPRQTAAPDAGVLPSRGRASPPPIELIEEDLWRP